MQTTVRRSAGRARSVAAGLAGAIWRSFDERDLLTYSAAIAFQVLFAILPLTLSGLAILGFLGLDEVWSDDLAPEVRKQLPADAFSVLDRTVERLLTEQRALWLTFGSAFALWQLSAAIRATTGPLNAIYGLRDTRGWVRRVLVSFGLALAIAPCLLLALTGVALGDQLIDELDLGPALGALAFVGRWALSIGLMLLAVWLLLHWGPARPPRKRWTSLGTGIVVAGWSLVSLGYGWYVTSLASYRTVFAGLASVIVLMTYVYLMAVVFLAGVTVDADLRGRANAVR